MNQEVNTQPGQPGQPEQSAQPEQPEQPEQPAQPSLGTVRHKLNRRQLKHGSIGSLYKSIELCLDDLTSKQDSAFGKRCQELIPIVRPFLDQVDQFYVAAYDLYQKQRSEEFNIMFSSVFFQGFNPRVFRIPREMLSQYSMRKHIAETYHFNATIQVLIQCLLNRIRLWADVLEQGWKGKQWPGQGEFYVLIRNLANSLPEPVEETFQVKVYKQDQNQNQEQHLHQDQNEAEMRTITRKTDRIVHDVGLILHQASLDQRSSPSRNDGTGNENNSDRRRRPYRRRPRDNNYQNNNYQNNQRQNQRQDQRQDNSDN